MRKLQTAAGVSLAAMLAAGAAQAQQQAAKPAPAGAPPAVEEIVVTAQKRAENLQDVPIAITALTAEALQNKRVGNLVGLSGLAPALQIKTDDNAANPRIFIRGVGVNDFNPSTASAVGIYVDGVYVASPLAQMAAFYDLQQIEVLRGPQGTLYGRNTTGGAINVATRKPSDTFAADVAAEYGRFNAVNVQGGVGGPIPILGGDVLSFRLSGLYVNDDGYTLNRLTGNHGNDADRWGLRGALRYKPNDRLTADLSVSLNQSRGGSILTYNRSLLPQTAAATGPDGLCAPGFYTSGQCANVLGYANTSGNLYQGDYRFEGRDIVNLFSASATVSYDLGPATLISVTSYQRAARNDQEETDANPLPILSASYIARQETASQELRLQSNGKTRLRYVAGLYLANDYLNNNSQYDALRALRNPTPANPTGADPANGIGLFGWPLHQTTKSYAVFGQVDYDLTERLTLTGGLRYSVDDKSFNYVSEAENGAIPIFAFQDSKTFSSLSGRAGVQYKLADGINLYATYNRGYKSGGFFSGQTVNPADLGPYQDEKVNAFEAGAKTEFFNRRLRANVSAFYYDYKDLQVYTAVVRNGLPVQLFTNASAARIYGGEAEIQATPMRGLDLSLGASALSAEYKDFHSAAADYSGNTLPSAPELSLNGTAHYEHDLPIGAFVGQVDFTYRSKIYFDTANTARLSDPARTFVNAQLGWRLDQGRYEVGLWGRNLFDETNISDITPLPSLGFDVISVGQPRTYGVYLRARY
ncbi:MAG: TonB-dependent receptor [Caulobacteraceae bacterium]|nr:TonB-dependent receptor [Caulobacteraceae bacterium]